jgi:hypothetical protein
MAYVTENEYIGATLLLQREVEPQSTEKCVTDDPIPAHCPCRLNQNAADFEIPFSRS